MVESVTIYRLWRTFSTKTERNVAGREKRLRNKEMGTNEFFKSMTQNNRALPGVYGVSHKN